MIGRQVVDKNVSSVLIAVAALVFVNRVGTLAANNASAAEIAEKTAPGAPTRDALVSLEKKAYNAWKNKNAKFWSVFLSDKFVGYGSLGKLDKASATKEYTGADCDIKSFTLSDEQMRQLTSGAALMTYIITIDGTCGGQAVPPKSRAASIFIRDGDQWKGAFHAEAPIIDPTVAPAKPVDKKEAYKRDRAEPDGRDARTDAMLSVERAVWEAWRAHDAEELEALTAREISFINIFGTYFANKADALKDWTGAGCEVKSVSVTDAAATMLSSTLGILTFRGAADGNCYGQKVGPISGTSVYVNDGNAWKWSFGINLPAH